MNEIEKMFYDALCRRFKVSELSKHYTEYYTNFDEITCQKPIGIYRVDFYFKEKVIEEFIEFAVEIDGHESHKTKAQRCEDYQRERFLQKRGINVVRFMASEVFVDADLCVSDFLSIAKAFCDKAWDDIVEHDRKKGLL